MKSAPVGLVLRTAIEPDLAAITEIYRYHVACGTASFEIELPDLDEMKRRWRETIRCGFPYIVAELDGKVLGYAYAGQYRPRIGYRCTVEDSVYIHHEHVGKGLGGALLAKLIRQCEGAGFRQMVAAIGDSTNLASIRLHEEFGFTMVGTLNAVCWKFNRWIDSILMQKELGEGDRSPPRSGK
jgi:L-amino acid N-acyltransferase YncA